MIFHFLFCYNTHIIFQRFFYSSVLHSFVPNTPSIAVLRKLIILKIGRPSAASFSRGRTRLQTRENLGCLPAKIPPRFHDRKLLRRSPLFSFPTKQRQQQQQLQRLLTQIKPNQSAAHSAVISDLLGSQPPNPGRARAWASAASDGERVGARQGAAALPAARRRAAEARAPRGVLL